MLIQNHTDTIQHFGKSQVPPKGVGEISDDFENSLALERMEEAGAISVLQGRKVNTEAQQAKEDMKAALSGPTETAVKPPVKTVTEILNGEQDDEPWPADFATMHASKAKAWVRRCNDVSVLNKLQALEKRKGVGETIRNRLIDLED